MKVFRVVSNSFFFRSDFLFFLSELVETVETPTSDSIEELNDLIELDFIYF